jgi:hypothetical protein
MVQNNMEVIRDCSMTVIVDRFSRQNHNEHSGPLEAATWLKRVLGRSYMGGEQDDSRGNVRQALDVHVLYLCGGRLLLDGACHW